MLSNSELIIMLNQASTDRKELAKLLIVSKVEINENIKNIEAHRIDAIKCPRCWNYVDKLEKVDDETAVCHRCKEVLVNE